jgi:hypothetical protein
MWSRLSWQGWLRVPGVGSGNQRAFWGYVLALTCLSCPGLLGTFPRSTSMEAGLCPLAGTSGVDGATWWLHADPNLHHHGNLVVLRDPVLLEPWDLSLPAAGVPKSPRNLQGQLPESLSGALQISFTRSPRNCLPPRPVAPSHGFRATLPLPPCSQTKGEREFQSSRGTGRDRPSSASHRHTSAHTDGDC